MFELGCRHHDEHAGLAVCLQRPSRPRKTGDAPATSRSAGMRGQRHRQREWEQVRGGVPLFGMRW